MHSSDLDQRVCAVIEEEPLVTRGLAVVDAVVGRTLHLHDALIVRVDVLGRGEEVARVLGCELGDVVPDRVAVVAEDVDVPGMVELVFAFRELDEFLPHRKVKRLRVWVDVRGSVERCVPRFDRDLAVVTRVRTVTKTCGLGKCHTHECTEKNERENDD